MTRAFRRHLFHLKPEVGVVAVSWRWTPCWLDCGLLGKDIAAAFSWWDQRGGWLDQPGFVIWGDHFLEVVN